MNPVIFITGYPLHDAIRHGKSVKKLFKENKWGLLDKEIVSYKDDAAKPWYEQNIPHALSVMLSGILLFVSFGVVSTITFGMIEIDKTIFFNAIVLLILCLTLYICSANKHIMNGEVRGVIIYRNILLVSFILCVIVNIVADLHGRNLFHLIITWGMLIFCRSLMNSSSFLDYVAYYRAMNIINKKL